MNSELQEMAVRIRESMATLGGLRAYSEASGISERTIANWVSATSEPKAIGLKQIAELTGVSLDWLITGMPPKFSADKRREANVIQTDAYISVPRYDAEASAGHGSFIQYAKVLDHIPFTEDFLMKRLGRSNAEGLILVDARGDSMEPTINDNDLIMIDMKQSHNITAAIYAFTYEDGFFVKRINRLPDAYEVRSDNDGRYPSFIIEREQMNQVEILGRVVWIGHTP